MSVEKRRYSRHGNAALSYRRRKRMVEEMAAGLGFRAAARRYGVSQNTVKVWRDRYKSEGEPGLHDRPSGARQHWHSAPAAEVAQAQQWRRERVHPAVIAKRLGRSEGTVYRWFHRVGLGRLKDLSEPPPDAPTPPKGGKRYERKHPGEIVHRDMKTVPRFKTAR